MQTELENRMVKSLAIIAQCMLKSNKMAEEALKKSNELHNANMAMMKESQIEYDGVLTAEKQFPEGRVLLDGLDGT